MNIKKVYAALINNYLKDNKLGCLYGGYEDVKMLSPDGINAYFLYDEPFPFDIEKLQKIPADFVKNFVKLAEDAEPVEEKRLQEVTIAGEFIEGVCLRSANNEVIINKRFMAEFSKNATYRITDRKQRINYAFVYENDQLVGMLAEIKIVK